MTAASTWGARQKGRDWPCVNHEPIHVGLRNVVIRLWEPAYMNVVMKSGSDGPRPCAGLSATRRRVSRFAESATTFASIFFGVTLVIDVHEESEYRWGPLIVMVVAVAIRCIAERRSKRVIPEALAVVSLGLASLVFESVGGQSDHYPVINWIVSGTFALVFVLIAHGFRHSEDSKVCWMIVGAVASVAVALGTVAYLANLIL